MHQTMWYPNLDHIKTTSNICLCKVWVLKENIKNKLMVFERKVLRKIFSHTKERDGTWKIKQTMN